VKEIHHDEREVREGEEFLDRINRIFEEINKMEKSKRILVLLIS